MTEKNDYNFLLSLKCVNYFLVYFIFQLMLKQISGTFTKIPCFFYQPVSYLKLGLLDMPLNVNML